MDIRNSTVAIPLTRGQIALVDAWDWRWLVGFAWQAWKSPLGRWYATTGIGQPQRTVAMHQILLPVKAPFEVDHINGDGLDNRRTNLRIATRSLNQANVLKHGYRGRSASSRFKGVARDRGRWRAYIRVSHRLIHLGNFLTEVEAAAAYNAAALQHFGPFAQVNGWT